MMAVHEVEENIVVGQKRRELSGEEIRKFMNLAGEAGKGFCRNCGYCLPCPEGIPIPDVFRYENYYRLYGLKEWAQSQYGSLGVKAPACSDCRQCLDKCPYGVSIPENLRKAHEILKDAKMR
jgi:predicted aldo/keto reductase-like oxidoreductase